MRSAAPRVSADAAPRSGSARAATILSPLTDLTWDEDVARCPGATIFHSARWARVLHDTYGFMPAYAAVRSPAGVSAALPVMEVRHWTGARRGVSLPFSDQCDPIATDERLVPELFEAAAAHGTTRRWRFLECRTHAGAVANTPAEGLYLGHTLALLGTEASQFARLSSATRRAVLKAERNHLQVEASTSVDAVRAYYRLHCLTRRRHGLPPQPFRFFRNIARHILATGCGQVILVSVHGTVVAGAVFFRFAQTATYKFGASDPAYDHLRPNNLIMWNAIRRYTSAGCSVLDFGRTSLGNEGLRRYKLGWGVDEHAIRYVRRLLPEQRCTAVPDRASGWYNRLFRLLPVMLARPIGAALYRYAA